MNYQITINLAEGIDAPTAAKVMAAANNAILRDLGAECRLSGAMMNGETVCTPNEIITQGGGIFAEVYASEITEL